MAEPARGSWPSNCSRSPMNSVNSITSASGLLKPRGDLVRQVVARSRAGLADVVPARPFAEGWPGCRTLLTPPRPAREVPPTRRRSRRWSSQCRHRASGTGRRDIRPSGGARSWMLACARNPRPTAALTCYATPRRAGSEARVAGREQTPCRSQRSRTRSTPWTLDPRISHARRRISSLPPMSSLATSARSASGRRCDESAWPRTTLMPSPSRRRPHWAARPRSWARRQAGAHRRQAPRYQPSGLSPCSHWTSRACSRPVSVASSRASIQFPSGMASTRRFANSNGACCDPSRHRDSERPEKSLGVA